MKLFGRMGERSGSTSKARSAIRPMVKMEPLVTGEVAMTIPRFLFDEEAYLRTNADVAAVVNRGETSAYTHYPTYGHKEEIAGARPRSLPRTSEPLGASTPSSGSLIDRIIHLKTEKRALLEGWDAQLDKLGDISFEMLSEDVDDAVVSPLDKSGCDDSVLDDDQRFWRENGYLIKEKFIPDDLIERYCAIRRSHPRAGGWELPRPLYACTRTAGHQPLQTDYGYNGAADRRGHGVTSQPHRLGQHRSQLASRRLSQPPYVNSWYCAVWVALDDIHPDSGPFEFVPGSHRWPLMKSHKVRMFLKAQERNQITWPQIAERFVNDIAEREIVRRGYQRKKFIAKKGDVLFWHGRLMHRGSYANVPGMERKTLISHYSGISHRTDMPDYRREQNGKAYFVHDTPLDWDPYAAA